MFKQPYFYGTVLTCVALQMFALDPSHWPSLVRRFFLLTVRNLFKDVSASKKEMPPVARREHSRKYLTSVLG